MPTKPEPHEFHLRLPPNLLAILMDAKGSKSLNREILDRLRNSVSPDEATQFADALRPLLATLSESDRREFVNLAIDAVKVLARGKAPKRQPRNRASRSV